MTISKHKGVVFVIDDDEAILDSIQWYLSGHGYRVICYGSAEEFLTKHDPRILACALVDIRMPGMTGLELQSKLTTIGSPLPIAFMTGHGSVEMAVQAMQKGAIDFIQKPFDNEALLDLVSILISRATHNFSQNSMLLSRKIRLKTLTKREEQVLELIVKGLLNKQIAGELGISIKTVEAHRKNLMEKLNANTPADLIRIALEPKIK